MTFELTIDTNDLAEIFYLPQEKVNAIQNAGAAELLETVRSNFGQEGVDRPEPWGSLTDRYAKRVGRSYATLYLDGEEASKLNQVSGLLFDSNQLSTSEENGGQYAMVFNDCVYAEKQQSQYPFFPFTPDGEVTSDSYNRVIAAMQTELERN